MCHRDYGEAGVSWEVIGMWQPFWELVAYKIDAKAFGKAGWACNCGVSGCSRERVFAGDFAAYLRSK